MTGPSSGIDVTASPSPFLHGVVPITETDDEIRTALEQAELPPLLPALAYLTGDLSLLAPHLRPDPLLMSMPQGGLTDEQQAEIRVTALRVLGAYRDGGCRLRADQLPRQARAADQARPGQPAPCGI